MDQSLLKKRIFAQQSLIKARRIAFFAALPRIIKAMRLLLNDDLKIFFAPVFLTVFLCATACLMPLQANEAQTSKPHEQAFTPASSPADMSVSALKRHPKLKPKHAQIQLETYAQREDAMQFAATLAASSGLDEAWLRRVIGQARKEVRVIALMRPPPPVVDGVTATVAPQTAKNWAIYRSNAVNSVRVQAGLKFWQKHGQTLAQAQARYGVPAEIILGVLGVETVYGQHMGQFRVIDALATLAFDFPATHPRAAERSAFFKAELGQFLALKNMPQQNLLKLRGSYAGAMGQPQFMPSSWARYGVDFDNDEQVDLFASASDVIASVAHYLQAHGWARDMATHFEVQSLAEVTDKARQTLLAPDIVPSFSAADFAQHGVALDAGGAAFAGKLALVELKNGDAPASHVAGTQNFYVLTRYNWSAYYAMAVIELGQRLGLARQVVGKPLTALQQQAPQAHNKKNDE
jgi:membrane-bound lytic murein transglycosylase B